MSRKMILSILHLYNYNNRLFDKMVFPEGFTDSEKETTINSIVTECAELEVIYPRYPLMQSMIGTWSKMNISEWNRIYKASLLTYNPIENYNRTEIETINDSRNETHSGSDKSVAGGKDIAESVGTNTENHGGSDTNTTQKTACDSGVPKVAQIDTFEHGETITTGGTSQNATTYGRQDTFTHGEKIDHTGENIRENHTSGNIGTMSTQTMLEQELTIAPKLNVIKIIVQSFKERFCIEVY